MDRSETGGSIAIGMLAGGAGRRAWGGVRTGCAALPPMRYLPATDTDTVRVANELARRPQGFPRVVIEAPIEIALEVSCIVARDARGAEAVFPIFENAHRDHILDTTLVPARISPPVADAVREVSVRAARAFDLVGLLTTEFFLSVPRGAAGTGIDIDGLRIQVNEFAPRPHNSGHVTRSACTASQYDLLARVLVGAELHAPRQVASGYFCMGNLLGDVWLAQGHTSQLDLSAWRDFSDVIDVVLYGKKEAAPKRKMGHFVTYADSAGRALERAHAFREAMMKVPRDLP